MAKKTTKEPTKGPIKKPILKNLKYALENTKTFFWLLVLILFFIYLSSSIYSISPNQVGVLQRFGKIINKKVMPGIHYCLPWPVDRIDKVSVKKIHRIIFDDFSENSYFAKTYKNLTDLDSYCITGDNNVVNLTCVLQYTIDRPLDYLFRINKNEQVLRHMISNTIIHTLASMTVSEILTHGKSSIENNIKQNLQERLNFLKSGLNITFVELKDVRPSKVVQSYFNDVINAQIDKKKYITTAESYYNEQIMKAKAQAIRIAQNSKAYQTKVIAQATGETKRFLNQLKQSSKHPKTTKQQLYMQFVSEVWPKIGTKYVVEPHGADNLVLQSF